MSTSLPGMDYRRFADQAYILGPREYRKYEHKGFSTPTGKVQLSCPHLADSGSEPLPTAWAGPPDEDERERFPLLLTSAISPYRFHSAGRQLERLRRLEPEPLALLHPVTADRFGLVHDGWAWIETTTGRIKQKVAVTEDLPPNVVCAAFGRYEPLADGALPAGWQEANLNVLTAEQPWGAELATPLLRPIRCRIKPA